MRKFRLKKNQYNDNEPPKAFANVQVKGKAMKKAVESLPNDPLKRQEILETILNEASFESAHENTTKNVYGDLKANGS